MYHGGRSITFSRRLEEFPVLAKAGAILPLSGEGDTCTWENPKELEVWVYPGADNCFIMYEEYTEEAVQTLFVLEWSRSRIRVCGRNGRYQGMRRRFKFRFPGWKIKERPVIQADGQSICGQWQEDGSVLTVAETGQREVRELLIFWQDAPKIKENDYRGRIFAFLREAQISFMQKEQILHLTEQYDGSFSSIAQLHEIDLDQHVAEVLYELLN